MDTQLRKPVSPDSTSSFESAFAEGDLIGVSSSAGRININQMSNVTSDQENSNRIGLNNSERIVNSDLLLTKGNGDAIVFNIVPNVLNIAKIFGVPFKTFVDIEDLMNGLKMGKHKKRLTDENPSVASNVRNMTMDTINEDTLHVDDSPIVQSITIQDKPRSYVGVAGGSKPEPSKSKANFRSLSSENLCEGATFSIPRKVFSEYVLSIIASQIESLTMGVPLIDEPRFIIETVSIEYEWKPPRCDICKIFGHVMEHFSKKVLVPPTVFTPTEDTIPMYNSYAALDEETDEDVENVYDESANLFHSTKTGGSSSTFMTAAG
ncbi:hypothetical protein Tco_1155830 [Tanacetum coccineum]